MFMRVQRGDDAGCASTSSCTPATASTRCSAPGSSRICCGCRCRYFEHRPTGVLVARLHGVETIREFIAGAAVTLLLDLPFLLIFLAVMFYYSWQLSLIALGCACADRRS